MIEITADMEAIVKQAILSFVATVNEDGTPNLSPKASLMVTNGVLYFADIASPRTILNLKRNPAIEINVVDIFHRRGYRFAGRALILPPNDDESLMIANWVRATNGLGSVEIQDSQIGMSVIQAPKGVWHAPIRFDGCAVGEDGAALLG